MRPQEPFQFSLASFVMIATLYALLFGVLRSLGVGSAAFIMVTLYFTAVVYGRWATFNGRNPYYAAFLVGGVLFVLGYLAGFTGYSLPLQVCAFPLGGFIGVGVAGMVDVGLHVTELLSPSSRKSRASGQMPSELCGSQGSHGRATSRRSLQLTLLALLVCNRSHPGALFSIN